MHDMDFPGRIDPRGSGRVGPLLERPYVVLGELPTAMAEPGGRGAHYWPLVQFIKDWNNQPEAREQMLEGGVPSGTDAFTAAKIAAVVHALCQRDGHAVPVWVMQARAPVDVALVPAVGLDSPFGRGVRRAAPEVCRYHRVYFTPVDLCST